MITPTLKIGSKSTNGCPAYESEYKPAFSTEPYWSRDVFSFYVANVIRKYGRYDAEEHCRPA